MHTAKRGERSRTATPFNEALYKELVKQRKDRGLPPLEDVPGLDRATVSRIRRGLREPGVGKAILLADHLGTTVKDLWPVAA